MSALLRAVAITGSAIVLTTSLAFSKGNSDWQMYNGDYASQRFSNLKQITTVNVKYLQTICSREMPEGETFETGLVVHGGIMFATTTHDTWAIDAQNCDTLWHEHIPTAPYEPFNTNRGVAIANNVAIRGTPGGQLIALDILTGRTVWEVSAANPGNGEFLSSAPIAWAGKVYIGTAGSDWGARGRMMAFDSATGRRIWTFHTIPMDGETGSKSWTRRSAATTGGGGMWTSYTLDPKAAELFIPVGNPAPNFAGSERPGTNLFTDSLVVLDARTGKLKWWFQLDRHDVHDADLAAAPMLYKVSDSNRVALGAKDGFVYSIDRKTHRMLFVTPVTTIKNESREPSKGGVYVCPGLNGGVEWNGPALDQLHHSILTNSVDWCGKYYVKIATHEAGQPLADGSFLPDFKNSGRGWLTALDERSGKVKWHFHAESPMVAAVTPTAGGLVFTGDLLGDFLAFDSKSGKILYRMNLPGSIAGGIITYESEGRQLIATTSGNISKTGLGRGGIPTVFVLGLPQVSATERQPTSLIFELLSQLHDLIAKIFRWNSHSQTS